MNKLLEVLKNVRNKWNELSKRRKIVFIIIVLAIIVSLITFIVSKTRTKYAVLFSKLDSADATTIMTKLDNDKIAHKEDSTTNTIYVPENQVDKLRLEYASTLKNGSTGFELFDNTNNKFGTTDAEFNVEYQRALQGELERTIKGLDSVDDARVTLVMAQDSAFVKDTTPGSASVTIKMKDGQTLSKSQVMAIISLISGSVKNIPKANVQVIDNNMNLLSKGLYNSSSSTDSSSSGSDSDTSTAEGREKIKSSVESGLEKKVLDSLESIYGKDKVKVKIDADLNFDSQENDAQTYYENKGNANDTKNPVIVSQQDQESTNSEPQNNSGSTIDNNANSNTITNGNGNSTSSSKNVTTNYDVSNEKTKTVKAPGYINRLTVSVVVDGKVSANTQSTLTNVVGNAVGFNQQRGDSISIEGLPFDTTAETNAKKALKEMQQEKDAANKRKLYIAVGIGVGILLLAIITAVILIIRKRRQAAEEEDEEELDEDLDNTQNLDVVVGDDTKKQKTKFAPIDFEGEEDEQSHLESEIKKYASTKPEQVVDIVKAWLSSDER